MKTLNLKNKMQSTSFKPGIFLHILLTTFCLLLTAPLARGATFYFDKDSIVAGVGDSFRVDVLMDSPENVNAVEGRVVFPGELLELAGINDGNSIISLWIQRPELVAGQIFFSGAIPGGFPSNDGKLFSLDFKIKSAGSGSISISKLSALLNDGEGSSAIAAIRGIALNFSKTATGVSVEEISDKIPPEDFPIAISADPNIFEGKKFASFTTQDKGSGIAGYEVAEQQSLIFRPNPTIWEKTGSPYLLKDQSLQSWVGVRVSDRNGNQREVWIIPQRTIFYRYLLTIIGGIIAVIVLLLLLRARWQR